MGGSANQLNGGKFQPTDIITPPTNNAGVLGTVPDSSGKATMADRAKAGIAALFGDLAKSGQQQQAGYVTQRGPDLQIQIPQITNNPTIPQLYFPVMPGR